MEIFHVIASPEAALKHAYYNVCKCIISHTFKIETKKKII